MSEMPSPIAQFNQIDCGTCQDKTTCPADIKDKGKTVSTVSNHNIIVIASRDFSKMHPDTALSNVLREQIIQVMPNCPVANHK